MPLYCASKSALTMLTLQYARALPNFLTTGLGHAAYTRRDAMLFHARLVTNHFYPPRVATPWGQRVRVWLAPQRLLPPAREPSTPDV